MLATFMRELAFAVGIMPVADIPTLMWSNGEGTAERAWAESGGVTFEVFCRSMAVHAPLAQPGLAIDPTRVLLLCGRGDRIVPPQHAVALWEHWCREPRLSTLPGSHLAPFGRRALTREIESHLGQLGVLTR